MQPATGPMRWAFRRARLTAAVLVGLCGLTAPAAAAPAEVALPLPVTRTAAGLEAVRCTFEQCLSVAIERSPLVRAAGMSLDLYEAKAKEAASAMWPKLGMTGFASVLPRPRTTGTGSNPLDDYDWSDLGPLLLGEISVTQPLYTFGKIDALKRLAAQGVEIGRATRRVAENEMRYQLARAWWGLVLVTEMQDIIREGTDLLTRQRRKLERQRDEGDEAFNQADLLRLMIFSADFEERVRQAERGKQQALDGLRMAMDLGTGVLVQPKAELAPLEYPPLPIEAFEALAMANHPRLVAHRQGVLARLVQVEVARTQLWPDLVAVGRLAGVYAPNRETDPDSLATNPNNVTTSGAGLALRWSLDIFRQNARIDQAQVEYVQQMLQERGERDQLRMEVRQLYRELMDARAMIDVQAQALKAARGWLNAENELYESGFQEFAEVLRAMEAWYRRRLAWLESIHTHNLAVAALSRSVGIDITRVDAAPVAAPPAGVE